MSKKATIIAVVNQKGGTGKTTTTENLGVGLALEGKKVLLVDTDPQASLTVSLGNPCPDDLFPTLSDLMGKIMMENPIAPGEGILHHPEGVDLVPSNIELSGMEVALVNAMSRETILRQYLDTVKQNYDYILLDCMPSLGMNKGKTVAQCLADRTDYSQNAAKTNDGEFISSYECDPKTADEEFLLSKRQYQHITGRQQKNNIIAYQIRQSIKPGEITPEEANQVGYETAMRWTRGKHAFIVATHIDKSHIHNHIIYNSTSLDATRKFKNFFLSGLAVQRLSDMVCLEHGLSIITPKPYRERQKRTVYPKKRTQRDELCDAIDAVLKQKPKSFDGFVQALADMGFEFKDGKQPAFKGENQKRFIRQRSLDEGYSKEEIQAVISGKNLHKSKGGSAKAPTPKQFQMLIDIQAKMAEGKTVGYERWAKKFNRKEAARTVILLKEKGLGNYDDLTAHIENLSARFDALSDSIKAAEKRMVEVQALQQYIKNYRNTRQIYIEYRKSGYSKKFFEEHRQEITIHKAAKQAFDELQITKLPSMQSLYEEFHQLAVQKKQDYAEYRQIRKEKEELLIAKRTVETILNIDRQKRQEQEKKTVR